MRDMGPLSAQADIGKIGKDVSKYKIIHRPRGPKLVYSLTQNRFPTNATNAACDVICQSLLIRDLCICIFLVQ